MNRYMTEKWPWIEGTHQMRSQFLDILNDDDLTFNPGRLWINSCLSRFRSILGREFVEDGCGEKSAMRRECAV